MWALVLIVVAAVNCLVIKSVNKSSRMAFAPINAQRSRYSKGTITRNEHKQIKENLEL